MAERMQCPHCDKDLSCTSTLNRHIYRYHRADTASRSYKCDICSKDFRREDLVTSHVRRVHSGLDNAACPVCSEIFRKDNLQKHIDSCVRQLMRKAKKRNEDPGSLLQLEERQSWSPHQVPSPAHFAPPEPAFMSRKLQNLVQEVVNTTRTDGESNIEAMLQEIHDLGLSLQQFDVVYSAYTFSQEGVAGAMLVEAAESGKTHLVNTLLAADLDVDCTNASGETALHCACLIGYPEIVKRLISHGADLDLQDSRDLTPLSKAVFAHRADITKALLTAGADASCPGPESYDNPLSMALRDKNFDLAVILVEYNADTNIYFGKSPCEELLHIAAEKGDTAFVTALIQRGVDIDPVDWEGYTPLDLALRSGHLEVADTLAKYGAKYGARGINLLYDIGPLTEIRMRFRELRRSCDEALVVALQIRRLWENLMG